MTYDLLIANASVIDGTGCPAYQAHVWIKDDEIALIEESCNTQHSAHKTIEAQGLVLTPGFIDAHAHGEPFKTPGFRNFMAMGVTTICLGQDGFSPDLAEDSYASGENLSSWMNRVDHLKPGVNIVMFAGHNTIRMLSGATYEPVPTEAQFRVMEQLLREAMQYGCFGMTTGLEYNPGYHTAKEELIRLAKTVGEQHGLIMSHMRSEDNATIDSALEELLAQGQYCPVHVSHIKVVYGKGKERAQQLLRLMHNARGKGVRVTADFYPYTASYTSIEILFPDWAKKPNNYEEVTSQKGDILKNYLRNKIIQRNGPEATLIGTGPFRGKTLACIAEELHKPFEDVLMQDIGPYGAYGAYFIMDEDLQETLLKDPHIMLCTDGSPAMNHPRSFGAFAKMIETFTLKKQLFGLEEAIRKMTGLTAETIGLTNRGLVKAGYKADLLLFNPSEVKENTTFEDPKQLATGFRYIILNGQVVKEGDAFSEARAGRMLRKKV